MLAAETFVGLLAGKHAVQDRKSLLHAYVWTGKEQLWGNKEKYFHTQHRQGSYLLHEDTLLAMQNFRSGLVTSQRRTQLVQHQLQTN